MPEGWCFLAEVLVSREMHVGYWNELAGFGCSWLVHLRSIGIGYGYGVAKEVPKGETWA